MNTATSIFHPKSQNLPAADLLLAVSPKLLHIYWCHPLSLWPKLQHYIPIFGLVILPKWRPRYMGFMQLDYPIAGYRAM